MTTQEEAELKDQLQGALLSYFQARKISGPTSDGYELGEYDLEEEAGILADQFVLDAIERFDDLLV